MSGNLDQELLLALNSLAGSDMYVWKLTNNPLLRGFPIFFAIVALWFVVDCRKRRSRMFVGLLAVCVATILSLWLQYHLTAHTRPFLDQALSLKVADPQWRTFWDHTSSFPSDTATLFFALAAVVFLENRLVGFFCFLWVTGIIAIPRIIFGWHYPSDMIGSVILGSGCVYSFNKIPYLRMLFDRTLILFEGRMYVVHALLFIFLAEASNLFLSLQGIGKNLLRMLHS
jgi:membrane-associated phospholipid phosphatase